MLNLIFILNYGMGTDLVEAVDNQNNLPTELRNGALKAQRPTEASGRPAERSDLIMLVV